MELSLHSWPVEVKGALPFDRHSRRKSFAALDYGSPGLSTIIVH